nr:hypothetical protein [Pseudomonadota bacterium]
MPQSVVPVAVESKEAVQIPVVQQKNTVPPPVSNQRQLAIQCLDEAVKHGYLTKDEKRKILSEQNDHKLSCDITPYFSRNAAARNANLILDEALQLGNVSKSIYEQTKNSFINEPSLKNDPSLREDAVRKYANLNKISAEVERILANEVTKQIIPDDIMKQILDKKYTVETRHALARAYDPSDPYVKETIAILAQKKEIGSRLDIPGETESQKLSYLWHIPSSKIRFDQLEAGSKRSAKILKDLGVSFLPPEHSQEYINFKIRKDFEELTSEQKVAKLKLYYLYQGFSLPDSVNINEFSYIIEELYKDENDLTGVLFKLGKEINRQAKATLKEIESNKFLEDRIIYEILAFENDQENAAAIEQIAKDVKIP